MLHRGYTFGFPTSNLVVNPALFPKLPFDPARDLAPVMLAVMVTLGAEIVASSPQEFGAFIKSEIAKWSKLVREAGIKAE